MASFFRSNPPVTPLQQLIEKVTDPNLLDEDWDSIMKICDHVTMNDEHAKEAMRVIRKRLQISSTTNAWRSISLTLTLLEALTKNCGKQFHLQIAHKDFLREFRGVLLPKNSPPVPIQQKVLGLIQTWAVAFRDDPDLKAVDQFYQECKQQGIDFPPPEPDNIIKAAVSVKPSAEPPTNYVRSMSQPGATQNPSHPPRQVANDRVIVRQITAEQVAKLRSELDVVQTNGQIFGEMLVTLQPGEEHPQDLQLLTELYGTCKQMQSRIIDLLSQISLDDITVDLLRYNDEFNHSFKTYENYMEERQRRVGPPSASVQSPVSNVPSIPPSSPLRQNNEPALIKFEDDSAILSSGLNNLHVESTSIKHNTPTATASVITRPVSDEHQTSDNSADGKTSDPISETSVSSTLDQAHAELDSQFNIPAPSANNPNA